MAAKLSKNIASGDRSMARNDRLVFVPHEFRQGAEEVAVVDDDLVAFGPDRRGDVSRVRELVETVVRECDRKGLEGAPKLARHDRRDGAAVDAAGEKHAERN